MAQIDFQQYLAGLDPDKRNAVMSLLMFMKETQRTQAEEYGESLAGTEMTSAQIREATGERAGAMDREMLGMLSNVLFQDVGEKRQDVIREEGYEESQKMTFASFAQQEGILGMQQGFAAVEAEKGREHQFDVMEKQYDYQKEFYDYQQDQEPWWKKAISPVVGAATAVMNPAAMGTKNILKNIYSGATMGPAGVGAKIGGYQAQTKYMDYYKELLEMRKKYGINF